MSITINNTTITIDNETVSFNDIYNYAVDNDLTEYIEKLDNNFSISPDISIINGGSITDSNISVTVYGDLIQIDKTSELRLGKIRTNGSTYDGCTIKAPNIKNAYGFGNTDTSESGNLFLYNSIIDIFGFWSFFSGNNTVEIIDCFINGYGRIEGSNSILKNIIFKQSSGKYGILCPKGNLKIMENLSVYDSLPYETSSDTFKCSVYHNPAYSGNLEILYGEFDGYEDLAYIEENDGGESLTFKGSNIKNGYSLYRESDNIDFYHQFKFNPTVTNLDGSKASNITVIIKDKDGIEVFNGSTDQDGQVDVWVTYYEDIAKGEVSYKTPHTVTFSNDDITLESTIYIDKNLINFPILFVQGSGSGSDVDYDRIQDMLDALKTNMCDCVNNDMTTLNDNISDVDSGIRQILIGLGDKIMQNEVLIENSNKTMSVML